MIWDLEGRSLHDRGQWAVRVRQLVPFPGLGTLQVFLEGL